MVIRATSPGLPPAAASARPTSAKAWRADEPDAVCQSHGMGTINITTAQNTQGRIDVAGDLGSSELAMYVYDLAPGAGLCPSHYEYVEEWMLVVSGEVTARGPDGTRTAGAGSLIRWPAGPEGA